MSHPAFVQTLREFSPVEARLIDWLHGAGTLPAYVVMIPINAISAVAVNAPPSLSEVKPQTLSLALLNLNRLNVIEVGPGTPSAHPVDNKSSDDYGDLSEKFKTVFGSGINAYVHLSAFGAALAAACIGNWAAKAPCSAMTTSP